MATLDREAEPAEQTGVHLDAVFEVREAERDVPGLVLEREVRDLAGHRVGGIRLDEGQQI